MSRALSTTAHCLIYRLRKKGIEVDTKARTIYIPYYENVNDYVQAVRLFREFHLNVQYIIV